MGRRPDPKRVQAAKGNPGKRMTKADRLAARSAEVAELLAAQPNTTVEPPDVFKEGRYAPALKVWRELGPELERTNRLQPIHRQHFAMFCVYIAEWWDACDDIATHGYSQKVKTVAGGYMQRDRPAVRQRDRAYACAMDAASHFGLTPMQEYALFKDQSTVVRENPGLFNRGTGAAAETGAHPPSSIGSMSRHRSDPPGGRPH